MLHLETPLKDEDLRKLKLGDFIYLSGIVVTARDKAHLKAKKEGKFPVDLKDGVLFHAGPIVKTEGKEYKIISLGPTTSSRLNDLESDFIKKYKVKAVIGKGGMRPEIFKEHQCVYLAMTGGTGALGAQSVEKILKVNWPDLGTAEAIYTLQVKNMGPLLVAIDIKGNTIYKQ